MSNLSRVVVVMPTYNNCRTVCQVVDSVLAQGLEVIVVNDGSTDQTRELLAQYANRLTIVDYPINKGKGYALVRGFTAARAMGAQYAITIDSDAQHDACDIPKFVEAIHQHPGSMIVGTRMLDADNMPAKNSFANRFSNFWFVLHTGIALADTQSGFRLYPLCKVGEMRLASSRYESELEIMVRLAWRGVKFISVPIAVYYPEDRVTHFRPFADFVRISVLNTALTIACVVYGHPRRLFSRLFAR